MGKGKQQRSTGGGGEGPAGNCICPKCGTAVPHQRGTPCQERQCPDCGAKMLREGGYHHQLFRDKRG